jgi:pimeloyl-ACP methyl ester carboxylesterase
MFKRTVVIAASLLIAAAAEAQLDDPWSHHFIRMSDGAVMHYVEMGEGTPVILLHGAGGSGEGNWFRNGIGPALAETNRVIALDQRGHAWSDDGDRSKMVQDVLELMNQLGFEQAHIGGFSMGGAVTAALLASNPEKFLSVHFGGSGVTETPEFRDSIPPDPEGEDVLAAQATRIYQQAGADREAIRDEMSELFAPMRAAAPRAAEVVPGERALDLGALDVPILVVIGEYDRPLSRSHRLWREAKDFRLVVLEGRNHLGSVLYGTMPQKYIDVMVEFITANNPR